MSFKIGYVGIVGAPNVGKSSLMNAIIREKVAIVSPKPQTTRNAIVGIYNREDCQIVFVDTPGIHKSKDNLGESMNKYSFSTASDVDVLVVMVDGSKKIGEEQIKFIKRFEKNKNVILVVSKTDLTTFEKLYPSLAKLNELSFLKDIIPLSSHKNRNVDILLDSILRLLPDGNRDDAPYDVDLYTDKSVRFMAGEIIREKALLNLQDEIPHGVAVVVYGWDEDDGKALISADIICDKDGHKSIIIGNRGQMLKKIGMDARLDIEKMLDKRVNLNLFVKVRNNWKNNLAILQEIGYNDNDIN